MIQKRNDLSVRRQCELLSINRSGLYYKAKAQNEASRLLQEEIMAKIDYCHTKMPAIGSRKIMILLQDCVKYFSQIFFPLGSRQLPGLRMRLCIYFQ